MNIKAKRIRVGVILVFMCFIVMSTFLQAAPLKDIPMTLAQTDGTMLECFASGDEFFNYLHDKEGYMIIQNPDTGYYV